MSSSIINTMVPVTKPTHKELEKKLERLLEENKKLTDRVISGFKKK